VRNVEVQQVGGSSGRQESLLRSMELLGGSGGRPDHDVHHTVLYSTYLGIFSIDISAT
jgi:hypothetical protein